MKAISSITAAVREFVRDPESVGSAFPATKYMVRRTLARIDWSSVELCVELGPGTGRFTHAILARLGPDAKLLAIEPGEAFVEHLQRTCDDERLIVVRGEAQNLLKIMSSYGIARADRILSGIPFSTLDEDDARAIIKQGQIALNPNGVLIAYQMRRAIERYMEGSFQVVRRGYALWNIPPCHLYWAKPLPSE